MSFKQGDYIVAAIPNVPTHVASFPNNVIVRAFDNALPPGHLRFRQVLMIFKRAQRLVVLDHSGIGPAFTILSFSRARTIPVHLHQTAQQLINTQLGQFAAVQVGLNIAQQIQGVWDRFEHATDGVWTHAMWVAAVESLAYPTIAATSAMVYGGAAIMSNLALIGGAVGGGAAAGIGIVATGPGVLVLEVVNSIEDDDDIKNINRITGVAATATGAAASVACVSAAGITGLSASGITTGLVGVGSTVCMPSMIGGLIACGAMTGGITAVAVVPIWLLARKHRQNRIQSEYDQFASTQNGLGYAGPH